MLPQRFTSPSSSVAVRRLASAILVLASVATSTPAIACGASSTPSLRDHYIKRLGEGPVALRQMDIVSVVMPSPLADWRVETTELGESLKGASSAEVAAAHRDRNRFITVYHMGGLPADQLNELPMFHYWAPRAGTAKVTFTNNAQAPMLRHTMEFTVGARSFSSTAAIGAVRKVGLAQVEKTVHLGFRETLVITLPSSAQATWDTASATAANLELKEKQVLPDNLVRLVFRPLASSSRSATLTLVEGGHTYRFPVQHRPATAC